MPQRILIVSPHFDDEVLSAASFLEESLENVTIFYHSEDHAITSTDVLREENQRLIKFLGCHKRISSIIGHNDKLDTVPIVDLLNEYEQLLMEVKPHTIVLPNPSYNQDHRAVYEAALAALRPHDRIPFVKRVLIYEEPETFGTLRKVAPFKPQYFRKLDIERKMELVRFYKSQLRDFRSLDMLKYIAGVRGMQCNYDYAEVFEIARWVE